MLLYYRSKFHGIVCCKFPRKDNINFMLSRVVRREMAVIHTSAPILTQAEHGPDHLHVPMTLAALKVAPYSFSKSGKHMFQTQNLVHWYFVRRMKLNVLYGTAFWKSETVTKKCVTVVAMVTMTFQKWLLICV